MPPGSMRTTLTHREAVNRAGTAQTHVVTRGRTSKINDPPVARAEPAATPDPMCNERVQEAGHNETC